MYPFFVALHVLLCLFLMVIIMLQPGKGGDMSAAFGGGGSSTMFGPRGPTGLLQRATTVVAVMFMGTTITLALYSNRSMLDNANVDEQIDRLEQQERERKLQAPSPAPTDGAAPEIAPAPAEPSPAAPPEAGAP